MKINLKKGVLICNAVLISIIGIYVYKHSAIDGKSSFLFFVIPLLSTTFAMFKLHSVLLNTHRVWMITFYIVSVLFSLIFSVFHKLDDFDINFSIALFFSQLLTCAIFYGVFFYYSEKHVKIMKDEQYPEPIIKKVCENIILRKVERRIKGKVHPNALSKVAGGIATGVLTETLSSGRADLFSDNLIPAAMSIADSHLANFESGNYSVTGSHANDFNPATGLAMTSDYFDAGGDTYGSALNHDSLFSSDNHISGGFDNHSIDHGSSFSSGFDDSRY
ncbi:hypothetical protein SHM90_004558 [Salmonella enterica subsp. enterica serovar Infantis]